MQYHEDSIDIRQTYMNILNLHGFASAGKNGAAEVLRQTFPEAVIESPDLPVSPREALRVAGSALNSMLNTHGTCIVGSSFGGLYAAILGAFHPVKTVLINPSFWPHETLADRVGTVENLRTGEAFEWTREHVAQAMLVAGLPRPLAANRALVFLGGQDDVIRLPETRSELRHCRVIEDETQGHRFDLSPHADTLREFLLN